MSTFQLISVDNDNRIEFEFVPHEPPGAKNVYVVFNTNPLTL